MHRDYPALARVKLGGIHYTQPFSHYVDAGMYNYYFLAEWTLWSRPEQVAAYKKLRDWYAKLSDVVRETGDRFSGPVEGYELGRLAASEASKAL